MIDAYEDRKVATFYVPGAYLQTYLAKEKFTILLLEGKFVDIMRDINPKYKQHVRFKYGKKKLYLRILKEIYGMIKSALHWYKLYRSLIKSMGLQLNPYDTCVANNNINGKKCTIHWYVDNNKVSRVEQEVIDDFISKVEEVLPGLTFIKGNLH